MGWRLLILITYYLCITGSVRAQTSIIDSLSRELESLPADTNRVNVLRRLTGLLISQDHKKSIAYGKAGVALGKALNYNKGLAGCYLNISSSYNTASRLDSALIFIDSAIHFAHVVDDPGRLALVYLNRADIRMQLNDLQSSMSDCSLALKYAKKANSDDARARIFQTIGSVYYTQDRYDHSIHYYNKALDLYQKMGNDRMAAIVMNNLGNVSKHTGDPKAAISYFLQAIKIADTIGDLNSMSMYHGNLSDVYLTIKNYTRAEHYSTLGMKYAKEQGNALMTAVAYAHFGEIYLGQKKIKQAIEASTQAFQIAGSEDDLHWQHIAADLLSEAYSVAGDYKSAYEYQRISKTLGDSLVRQQFNEDIALLQTTFRLDQKDQEIGLLNKARELQDQQVKFHRYVATGSGILVVLVIAGVMLLINRYRMKQRLADMEVRNKIAADLHDEIGSSVSSISLLSEMAAARSQKDSYLNDLLKKISRNSRETIERMSDIVWTIRPEAEGGERLEQRMQRFLDDICPAQNIRYEFSVTNSFAQADLSMQQRKNLYLVFKEAVNNAVKYSCSATLDITIDVKEKNLELKIKDHGIGFNTASVAGGNGLDNMQTRAEGLKGGILVDSTLGKGTEVRLYFPV